MGRRILETVLIVMVAADWMSSVAVPGELEASRSDRRLATEFGASQHRASGGASAEREKRVRPWPCVVVAKPALLGVIEDAWARSATFRRQCQKLADANAVVVLAWGTADSYSQAVTRMRLDENGIVVAHVLLPPVIHAVELVAHEMEHVIERTEGVDFAAESTRRGSGVWRAHGGFETRRAIDAGRRVARELRESRRSPSDD